MKMATIKLRRRADKIRELLREKNPTRKNRPAIISSQGSMRAHRLMRGGGRMA
jgi:hypothetical protein